MDVYETHQYFTDLHLYITVSLSNTYSFLGEHRYIYYAEMIRRGVEIVHHTQWA